MIIRCDDSVGSVSIVSRFIKALTPPRCYQAFRLLFDAEIAPVIKRAMREYASVLISAAEAERRLLTQARQQYRERARPCPVGRRAAAGDTARGAV